MLWIALGVTAVLVVVSIASYNGLVRLNLRSQSAWADVDVQLERRHDLIPNLLETVQGYAAHERSVIDAVNEARNRALGAEHPAAKAEAEGLLGNALKSVFALAEAYPQLRAVESFTSLQTALAQIEDSIQNARRYYNAVVRDLNTKIAQFPGVLFAGVFGFRPREFFETKSEAEREVPKVAFAGPAR